MYRRAILIVCIVLCGSSLFSQGFNRSYTFNKVAGWLSSVKLINDTLTTIGAQAENYPPYPFKYRFSKFDSLGNEIYFKSALLDSNWSFLPAQTFIRTADGGYAFVGIASQVGSYDNAYFIKLKVDGSLDYYKIFNDGIHSFYGFRQVVELRDGSFLCAGFQGSVNNYTPLIVKINSIGQLIWQKGYSFRCSYHLGEFKNLNDSLSLLSMETGVFNAGQSYLRSTVFLKMDTSGAIKNLWVDTSKKTLPAVSYQCLNGDVIYTTTYQEYTDLRDPNEPIGVGNGYIVRRDSNYNIIWSLRRGRVSAISQLLNMHKLQDGRFISVGFVFDSLATDTSLIQSGWLVKFSENGSVIWERRFHFVESPAGTNELTDFIELPNGDLVSVGQNIDYFSATTPQRGWMIKVNKDGCLIPNCNTGLEQITDKIALSIYPNPSSNLVFVNIMNNASSGGLKLQLADGSGKSLLKQDFLGNETTYIFDLSPYPAGLYHMILYDRDIIISSRKIIKE